MIRKIEPRENEFTMQLKEMLAESFPLALGHEVIYIIGEDEKGRRGLYFELNSKRLGKLYSKFMVIETAVFEIEHEFMNEVINDLVLSGISFMNVQTYNKSRDVKLLDEITDGEFDNTVPRRLLFIN